MGESQGSGFFINSDGYIATNHHVIKDATSVTIEHMMDYSKKVYTAPIVDNDISWNPPSSMALCISIMGSRLLLPLL